MDGDATRKMKWRQVVQALQHFRYISAMYSGKVRLVFRADKDVSIELAYRRSGHEQIALIVQSCGLLPDKYEGKVTIHMKNGGIMEVVREERD